MPRGSYHKKIGELRAQQVVAALSVKPMTVEQLAAELGMCNSSIAIYLTRLHSAPKRIYVSGHERRKGGMPAVIWSAGAREDVEFVPLSVPVRKTSAAERIDQLITLLAEKPRTLRELGAAMHMVPRAVGKYTSILRNPANKRIYVKAWQHPSVASPNSRASAWAPIYAVGNKADKPMPAGETPSQRHARLYKQPEYRAAMAQRRKLDYMLSKARKQPGTWFAALPGAQSLAMKEAA